jgi:nucleoside-diphosphate-sugar epimerase
MGDRVVLAGLSGRRISTLKGRRAVVTGGTKGTGAAIVARQRSAGANVTAVARQRHACDDLAADDFVAADLTLAASQRWPPTFAIAALLPMLIEAGAGAGVHIGSIQSRLPLCDGTLG